MLADRIPWVNCDIMTGIMTKWLRHILVAVFFVLMFAYAGTSTYRAVRLLTRSSYLGWKATQVKGQTQIGAVRPDGPATLLEPGDQVLAIKSQEQTQPGVRTDGDWPVKSGTEYLIQVLRGGVAHEYSLETAAFPL